MDLELSAKALRQSRPGLPVVLATGYSPDVIASTASGHEIVRKPYDAHTVSSALTAALAEARHRAA
jgi:FixJ family two-component response regulator